MYKQKIIISGVNMVEGGIFTILQNVLQEISEFIKNKDLEVIALVHDASKFNFSNIQFIEFPKSKKSWFFRMYYEYFYFKKLSEKLQPDIWLSLHDTSPRVVAKKQFVYCHHPNTLIKVPLKDWFFDYKVGLFSVLYDYLFQFNIKKNHTVFVQQHWIKEIFEERFKINNVVVSTPEFTEEITTKKYHFSPNKKHFFYPSFPRSLKNHDVIFEAIKLLPQNILDQTEFHFTTFKNNKAKYAQYIIAKYGYLKGINFYGHLQREEILSMYNTMDCLVFPSKVETWGLPISEAKAYKKPMFLANLPYAKEACGNYDAVSFFNENSAQELAQIITEFVENKHPFQGNKISFPNSNVIYNWKELFDYMIAQ